MRAEIIGCGTELLLGHTINTNAAYLSNTLSRIGIDVFRHITVGDNKERLTEAVENCLSRADIVIVTGGLGPTVDDITMGTLAGVANKDLVFNKEIYKHIKEHFKKQFLKAPKDAIKQALIPRDSTWLKNNVGTAPGLIIKHEDKQIVALPGPPRELIPMVEKDLLQYLVKLEPQKWTIISRPIKLIGLPEPVVNEKVKDLLELSGHTTVGIYEHLGEVELRITAKANTKEKADSHIKKIEGKIRRRLKEYIYGAGDETLEGAVGTVLIAKKKTLAIAESCTGGLLSNFITNVPGSSKYYRGSVIAYSDDIKIKRLNVPKDIIKKQGAVSKETASAMAENVRQFAESDIGLGVTGIAGPTGATKTKPIGLVYIALSTKKKKLVKEFHFLGSREEIKFRAARQALWLIRFALL